MAAIDDLCGRVLGEFVLRERLDEGGFGTVYRADQPTLGRAAVVKVLRRRARWNDVVVQRFTREALLSSQLDHPYAAHVYAFGLEEDGLVWIAMELVQGVTLSRWLAVHRCMALEQFVPFFERLAEVVHVAHERGIVHRDLKPSNVMVIERAGQLLPKLLDFGVAALLDGVTLPHLPVEALALTDETPEELTTAAPPDGDQTAQLRPRRTPSRAAAQRLTRASAVIGSPPYMAPEQWTGGEVTAAMDIYALGVVAYEALSGRKPFIADTADAYARLHLDAPVPSLDDALAGLDPPLRRALAKNPEERFHSVLELSAALRFELESRMVAHIRTAARQWHERGRSSALLWRDEVFAELERWIERSAKADTLASVEFDFLQACQDLASAQLEAQQRRSAWRRRIGIAAAVISAAALVGVFQFRAWYETQTARRIAAATALQAEVEQGRAALLHEDLVEAQQHLAEAARRGDRSPATLFMLARASQPLQAEQARFAARSGRMWSAAWSPDGARIVTSDDSAAQIWDVAKRRLIATLLHDSTVHDAKFSADGTLVVTAGADGTVRIWRALDGAAIRVLRPRSTPAPSYFMVALSPDDTRAAAIDIVGAIVHVWDVQTGTQLAELSGTAREWPTLAFSADGTWLAAGSGDGIAVYDTHSWTRSTAIAGSIRSIAWDPTGPRLLTGTLDGDASIWKVPNRSRLVHLRGVGEAIDAVTWSPDGKLLATACRDGSEQVWATDGTLVSKHNLAREKIFDIEFDRSSRRLVAASANGTVAVSDAMTGMPITLLEGPTKLVRLAHFDGAGRRVLAASWDGTARIWDAESPYRRWSAAPVADDCGSITSVDPDRSVVAISCRDRSTRVWDTAHERLLAELPPTTVLPAVSVAGDRAAIARGDAVEVYELPAGRLLHSFRHRALVRTLAFATDGRDLISGAVDGSILIGKANGEPRTLPAASDSVDAVALLADGRALVADARGRVRVFVNEELVSEMQAPSRLSLLRPSRSGDRLVGVPDITSATVQPTLWDLKDYRAIASLDGHLAVALSARWVAGDRLITASLDGSAHMWDSTGKLLASYRGSTRYLADALLSPDGELVVGGGADGKLRFWEAATGRALWTTPAHTGSIVGLHYDGEDLITRGVGGDLGRWHFTSK